MNRTTPVYSEIERSRRTRYTDYEKMDIVISPSAKSISAIPKMYSGDNSNIYSYQRDLMASLEKGGVIEKTFIQGGLEFGVLEAL